MKVLSVIIMSKKGENRFIATANNFPQELALRYSVQIYDYFLFISRQGKKVDKIISIDVGISCNCSSYGDIFILVFVSYYQASLGMEASKKLTFQFKNNQKEEYFNKKFLEIQSSLEDFLYSRDFNSQKQLNTKIVNPNERQVSVSGSGMSLKPQADFEVFASFLEMDSVRDSRERNAIAVVPMKYWTKTKQQITRMKSISACSEQISLSSQQGNSLKITQGYQKVIGQLRNLRYRCAYKVATKIATTQTKQSLKTPNLGLQQNRTDTKIENKFVSISSNDVKNIKIPLSSKLILSKKIDLLDLEDSSPENKTHHMKAEVASTTQPSLPQPLNNMMRKSNQSISLLDSDEEEEQSQPRIQTKSPQIVNPVILNGSDLNLRAPITQFGIKIVEWLQIEQQDSHFPSGFKMHGQILIQGNFKDDLIQINLKGKNWNPSSAKHRGINNPFFSRTNPENTSYQIKIDKAQIPVPKPVIEILLNNLAFVTVQQVPLYFLYKVEPQINNSLTFKFQYMVNSRWVPTLEEVEFHIVLDQRLVFSDMQHNPVASSFQNKVLLWKTSRLSNKSSGNLTLTLNGVNLPPNEVLKCIRLSMKSESVVSDLDADLVYNNFSEVISSKKRLFIDYRILPNSK